MQRRLGQPFLSGPGRAGGAVLAFFVLGRFFDPRLLNGLVVLVAGIVELGKCV